MTAEIGPLNEFFRTVGAAIPGSGVNEQVLAVGVSPLKKKNRLAFADKTQLEP